jgi:hypothetical protein
VLVTVAGLLLAGCATSSSHVSPLAPPSGRSTGNPAEFDIRAAAVIKVWTDAGMPVKWRTGFVPLQDLTVIAPNPGFDVPSKQAFLQGFYRMEAGVLLPPPPGVVRFPDGSSMTVALQTESDAFAAIYRGECPKTDSQCRTLRITNVTLSSVKLLTSRGLAIVPAWAFTVAGLTSPIYRVAVAPSLISELPADPRGDWPRVPNLRSAQDVTSVTSTSITFQLGVGMCDKNVKAWVYETDVAVAVGGTAKTPGGVCADVLKLQPVTVHLSAPLGSRALLDATSGAPLQLAANQ